MVAKKQIVWTLTLIMATVFIWPSAAGATTRPYFKIFGGSIMAGGNFDNNDTPCAIDGSYQGPTYGSAISNRYKGGIMAYAKYNDSTKVARGASADLGAYALGLIEGPSGGEPYGFYSASGQGSNNELSFANFSSFSTGDYWGGYLAGSDSATWCIPDYYTAKIQDPTDHGDVGSVNLSILSSGQHSYSPDSNDKLEISSSAPLSGNQRLTIFVTGNAIITSDISYANSSTYKVDETPKLAVIVKGSLYIKSTVQRLDGLYIAQPDVAAHPTDYVTADTGVIWSCYPQGSVPSDFKNFVNDKCNNQLVFNGAVIAKQINLLRTIGDVDSAANGEGAGATNGGGQPFSDDDDDGPGTLNIAEVFSYTPEMILGGPFFNPPSKSSAIQSLISLPPRF